MARTKDCLKSTSICPVRASLLPFLSRPLDSKNYFYERKYSKVSFTARTNRYLYNRSISVDHNRVFTGYFKRNRCGGGTQQSSNGSRRSYEYSGNNEVLG